MNQKQRQKLKQIKGVIRHRLDDDMIVRGLAIVGEEKLHFSIGKRGGTHFSRAWCA